MYVNEKNNKILCTFNNAGHILQAGYQITQAEFPIASNGKLDFIVYDPSVQKLPYRHSVDLIQLQLEEDSGKSIHDTYYNRLVKKFTFDFSSERYNPHAFFM